MVLDQQRSRRKETGARYKRQHAKKKHALGRAPTLSKIGDKMTIRTIRTRGGHTKTRVIQANMVNLFDPKTKKYSQVKIDIVTANPANRHYVRRNIITKGTIIKTEKGEAKVTSRPGQDGIINAVLV